MTKAEELEKIAKQIEICKTCKTDSSGKPVLGEGNPDAKIVFIGEAPGKTEAKTGRPFVGRSGQLLRKFITSIGLKENDVYITSPVKYLPNRGTPSKKQILHGAIHLSKQLQIIDPEIIVLLGATAIFSIFKKPIPVLKNHGEIRIQGGRKYLLTLHPSAGLRFPPLQKTIKEDFEKLKKII